MQWSTKTLQQDDKKKFKKMMKLQVEKQIDFDSLRKSTGKLPCLKAKRQVKTHPLLPVSFPINLSAYPVTSNAFQSSSLTSPCDSFSFSIALRPSSLKLTEGRDREMKVWHIAPQGWCLLGNALCSTIDTPDFKCCAVWLESDRGEEFSDASQSPPTLRRLLS